MSVVTFLFYSNVIIKAISQTHMKCEYIIGYNRIRWICTHVQGTALTTVL